MTWIKSKRLFPTLLLFSVLLLTVGIFLAPRPVAKDVERISSIHITYMGEEITSFDETQVATLLSHARCHRVLSSYFPLYQDDVVFEIRFLYGGNVVHMVLGKDNFCYRSADDFWVSALIDAEAIQANLQHIVQ